MTSITRWQEKPPARQPRLVDVDYAILRLLDRAGILLVPLLARACMPGKAERTVRQKLAKLHDAGLIARGEIDVHDRSPGRGRASLRGPADRPRLPDRTATRGHRPR